MIFGYIALAALALNTIFGLLYSFVGQYDRATFHMTIVILVAISMRS